jgi:hypothetical protein
VRQCCFPVVSQHLDTKEGNAADERYSVPSAYAPLPRLLRQPLDSETILFDDEALSFTWRGRRVGSLSSGLEIVVRSAECYESTLHGFYLVAVLGDRLLPEQSVVLVTYSDGLSRDAPKAVEVEAFRVGTRYIRKQGSWY